MMRCSTIGLALAALCGVSTIAQARPPTVTPSPGYDARLQESRSAQRGTAAPVNSPAPASKRVKKKHSN